MVKASILARLAAVGLLALIAGVSASLMQHGGLAGSLSAARPAPVCCLFTIV